MNGIWNCALHLFSIVKIKSISTSCSALLVYNYPKLKIISADTEEKHSLQCEKWMGGSMEPSRLILVLLKVVSGLSMRRSTAAVMYKMIRRNMAPIFVSITCQFLGAKRTWVPQLNAVRGFPVGSVIYLDWSPILAPMDLKWRANLSK